MKDAAAAASALKDLAIPEAGIQSGAKGWAVGCVITHFLLWSQGELMQSRTHLWVTGHHEKDVLREEEIIIHYTLSFNHRFIQ